MITWHRSVKVKAGKWQEALQFAEETAEHLRSRPPQVLAIRVYEEMFGNAGTLHWIADHESLASMEAHMAQRMTDEEWLRISSRADDIFIEGSWHDTLMKAL